jgi:putative transcriptional regulator
LPGDLDEADSDVDHRPVVGQDSDCICLAALEGDTRLHGLLGRLLRPFVGF